MKKIKDQIEHIDEKIAICREGWIDAKPDNKALWMAKIDALLDERLELMKDMENL